MYRKNKNRISIKILLSYLSILVLPLFAIIAIYQTATSAILTYQKEKTMVTLEQTAHTVTLRLEELNNINSYIQSDNMTNSIINYSRFAESKRDISIFHQMLKSFPSYHLTNQMIRDVYIFFNEAEFIAKLPNAFAFNEYNYDNLVGFNSISYKQMQQLCNQRNYNRLLISSSGGQRDILLLHSLPNSSSPGGLIVVQIQENFLRDILNGNNTGLGGGTFALDQEGKLITCVGDSSFSEEELVSYLDWTKPAYREIKIDRENYLLCVYREYGISYVSLVKKSHLLSKVAAIEIFIVLLGGISLAMGVVICIALWRRRKSIVRKISATAKSVGVSADSVFSEKCLLESTVNQLAATVGSLRMSLNQQKDILILTLIRNLLQGSFATKQQMLDEFSTSNFSLDAKAYHVVNVILLEPAAPPVQSSQTTPYRLLLKQFLQDNLPIPHFACDIDNSSFVLLLTEEEEIALPQLREMFFQTILKMEAKDWIAPSFAVSDNSADPWKISELYRQSGEVRQYMACLSLTGVYTTQQLPNNDQMLYFPLREEIRLIQLIKSGTIEELEEFFSMLKQENLEQRKLGVGMLLELCEALRRSILRALQDIPKTPSSTQLIYEVSHAKSILGLTESAEEARQIMLDAEARQNHQAEQELRESLRLLVMENMNNPSFNLYMLSELSGIPENNLYRDFKTYFGLSFASYLERCRINLAFELLRQNTPVKDVAEQVGYTSDHTFRRAFKRVMKVPPSQFTDDI